MISAASKLVICKAQDFKKLAILSMLLIVLSLGLDHLAKDKNKNCCQLVIIKNLKEFKILNKGIFLEKYLDKEHLELLDYACTEIVKRHLQSRSWKKKQFNSNRFMFSYFKMSYLF
jgi:hypothetical protein